MVYCHGNSHLWMIPSIDIVWLVLWDMFHFPIVNNHPNWLISLQRGGEKPPTSQKYGTMMDYVYVGNWSLCLKPLLGGFCRWGYPKMAGWLSSYGKSQYKVDKNWEYPHDSWLNHHIPTISHIPEKYPINIPIHILIQFISCKWMIWGLPLF